MNIDNIVDAAEVSFHNGKVKVIIDNVPTDFFRKIEDLFPENIVLDGNWNSDDDKQYYLYLFKINIGKLCVQFRSDFFTE
jgi:hypothetical protein